MPRFNTDKNTLETFVNAIKCEGITSVDSDKVKSGTLFNDFVLDVKEDAVYCNATDTKSHKVIAQHVLKDVEIVEEGEIYVTDTGNFVKAMDRCGGGKGDRISVLYPDEYNGITIQRMGTKTAFSFPTQGKKDVTSLERTTNIPHVWDDEAKNVLSTSAKSGKSFHWQHKLIADPDDLAEIAKDMKDFVKQKVVTMTISNGEVLFNLGNISSTKKGKRQLFASVRQEFKDGKWMPAEEGAEDIVSNYYHGFYAVIQNIPSKQPMELYFGKFGNGYMVWIRSFSSKMDLHYLVPHDAGLEPKKETKS